MPANRTSLLVLTHLMNACLVALHSLVDFSYPILFQLLWGRVRFTKSFEEGAVEKILGLGGREYLCLGILALVRVTVVIFTVALPSLFSPFPPLSDRSMCTVRVFARGDQVRRSGEGVGSRGVRRSFGSGRMRHRKVEERRTSEVSSQWGKRGIPWVLPGSRRPREGGSSVDDEGSL